MPSSGKLWGGWARRNARTSSANACSSAVKPNSMRSLHVSAGQSHEGVAPERVVDHPLHLVHRRLAAPLEAQGEVGVGVRGPDQAPPLGEEDPRPVDVDRLVTALEVARELRDQLE